MLEVFTDVYTKIYAFCVVTHYWIWNRYGRFGEACRLYPRGIAVQNERIFIDHMLIFSTEQRAIVCNNFRFQNITNRWINLVFAAEFDTSIYFLWAADTQGRGTSRKETTCEGGSAKITKQSWMDNWILNINEMKVINVGVGSLLWGSRTYKNCASLLFSFTVAFAYRKFSWNETRDAGEAEAPPLSYHSSSTRPWPLAPQPEVYIHRLKPSGRWVLHFL
jgi:hypothetical protein